MKIKKKAPRVSSFLYEFGIIYLLKFNERITTERDNNILSEIIKAQATHILEKGVDIRYIKDILGHFSIKTTERYVHVKKELLIHIPSPLDDICKKGAIEW